MKFASMHVVCCGVLQCVASVYWDRASNWNARLMKFVSTYAVYCSVLQCVVFVLGSCIQLECTCWIAFVGQCVAMCCVVLQNVAVCGSAEQCVAVHGTVW